MTVTCPDLLSAATNGQELRLLRITDFQNGKHGLDVKDKAPARHIWALSECGTVYFTDGFFRCSDGFIAHAIVHELVHCADVGSLVAYSPQWIKCKSKYGSCDHSDNSIREQLAEVFAVYSEMPTSKSYQTFRSSVVPLLLSGRSERASFNRSMIKGFIQLQQVKNYDKAIEFFEEAARKSPSAPMAHVSLALCYQLKNDRLFELRESGTAYTLLNKLGVPASDRAYVRSGLLYARGLVEEQHDMPAARMIVTGILKANPDNADALKLLGDMRIR